MKADKGRIMEILDTHAVIMTRDGHFKRIKRKEAMRIGGEVLFTSEDLVKKTSQRNGWLFNFKVQTAIAMLVLAVVIISQITMPAAYAVVSLDINPSLEIIVSESKKVVSINPINSEADELLEAYVLDESKDLHVVINDLIKLSSTMGYLSSENHNIILATAMIDEKNSSMDSDEFMNEILEAIEEAEYTFDFTLVSTVRETDDLNRAKSEGLSLGRYAMEKEKFLPADIEAEIETDDQEKALPPGQEKKNDDSEKVKPVPPGQEIKEKNTPSQFNITEKKAKPKTQEKKEDKIKDNGNNNGNNNDNGNNSGKNKGGGKGN